MEAALNLAKRFETISNDYPNDKCSNIKRKVSQSRDSDNEIDNKNYFKEENKPLTATIQYFEKQDSDKSMRSQINQLTEKLDKLITN